MEKGGAVWRFVAQGHWCPRASGGTLFLGKAGGGFPQTPSQKNELLLIARWAAFRGSRDRRKRGLSLGSSRNGCVSTESLAARAECLGQDWRRVWGTQRGLPTAIGSTAEGTAGVVLSHLRNRSRHRIWTRRMKRTALGHPWGRGPRLCLRVRARVRGRRRGAHATNGVPTPRRARGNHRTSPH